MASVDVEAAAPVPPATNLSLPTRLLGPLAPHHDSAELGLVLAIPLAEMQQPDSKIRQRQRQARQGQSTGEHESPANSEARPTPNSSDDEEHNEGM
jgi:hypothetical protein